MDKKYRALFGAAVGTVMLYSVLPTVTFAPAEAYTTTITKSPSDGTLIGDAIIGGVVGDVIGGVVYHAMFPPKAPPAPEPETLPAPAPITPPSGPPPLTKDDVESAISDALKNLPPPPAPPAPQTAPPPAPTMSAETIISLNKRLATLYVDDIRLNTALTKLNVASSLTPDQLKWKAVILNELASNKGEEANIVGQLTTPPAA